MAQTDGGGREIGDSGAWQAALGHGCGITLGVLSTPDVPGCNSPLLGALETCTFSPRPRVLLRALSSPLSSSPASP
ncbi:hypothetical protein PMIN04_006687 [Paraphaeosphaeria minitans]